MKRQSSEQSGTQGRIADIVSRARVRGASIYLEALSDFQIWKRFPEAFQSTVMQAIAAEINDEFDFIDLVEWQVELHFQVIKRNRKARTSSHVTRKCRTGVFQHKSSGAKFHLIPGDQRTNEDTNQVQSAPFFIAQTPITQKQFPNNFVEGDPNLPAVDLELDQLEEWLTKHKLHLPTRGEWTHACRGTTNFDYYCGPFLDPRQVWLRGQTRRLQRMSVNLHIIEKMWNAYGLVDTIGNVFELLDIEECETQSPKFEAIGLSFRSQSATGLHHPIRLNRLSRDDLGFRPIRRIQDLPFVIHSVGKSWSPNGFNEKRQLGQ